MNRTLVRTLAPGPKGGELTEAQTAYNTVIRGVHGVAERANARTRERAVQGDLRGPFQTVSLSPTRIGAITKAALVLHHFKHDRAPPPGRQLREVMPRYSSRLIA